MANWGRAAQWALYRRHTWLSLLLRPPGDYLSSQKRSIVLLVLALNSTAVCVLLLGTEQHLGYIQGSAAVAIMALLIGE